MSCVTRFVLLRGTTAQRSAMTPLAGELVFDTTLSEIFIGDGSTAGGLPLTAASSINQTVRNTTGSTLAKDSIVYISGASGGYPEVTLADKSSEITSSKTIGILTQAIANNATGKMLVEGIATGVDTSSFSEGDTLWLGASGGIQNTIPVTPDHAVFIGYCLTVSPVSGTIFIKIQNGYEIGELHDVLISSPSDDQLLSYDESNGYWKNVSRSWDFFACNWDVAPTLNKAITGGDVYNYTYKAVTRYRFVPSTYNSTSDCFYASFNNLTDTLSDPIVCRGF